VGYIEGGILPTGQWHTKPAMEFLKFFAKHADAEAALPSNISYCQLIKE